jgi:hypothetical protein
MNAIRRLAFSPVSEGASVFATRTIYVSAVAGSLLQEFSEVVASDTFGNCYARRSGDNGATWSPPEPVFLPKITADGTLRRSEHALLHDARRGRVIRFSNQSLFPDPKKYTIEVARQTTIQLEISGDEGRTFSPPKQLIINGHDSREWAPEVCYGKNSSMISFSQPFFDRGGRIILPAQWVPVLPPDHTEPYRPFPLEAACYLGEIGADGGILWIMSERVALDPTLSVRGLCEPTVCEISGGRILMVCRGSNMGAPNLPGRKWISVSTDGGWRWSPAEPLGYDSGELFYSPATGSQLIRSSFNGKLYWIGNIIPENPAGNWPRHPLCIAEVDEERVALRKVTVFTIDDRGAEDTPRLQLSNFHAYEDRVTGEFVLLLARLFERSETSMVSPAYEYRIGLESA